MHQPAACAASTFAPHVGLSVNLQMAGLCAFACSRLSWCFGTHLSLGSCLIQMLEAALIVLHSTYCVLVGDIPCCIILSCSRFHSRWAGEDGRLARIGQLCSITGSDCLYSMQQTVGSTVVSALKVACFQNLGLLHVLLLHCAFMYCFLFGYMLMIGRIATSRGMAMCM